MPIFLPVESKAALANPPFFGSLLVDSRAATPALSEVKRDARVDSLNRLDGCADQELAKGCSALRHPNGITLLATADVIAE